jgi:hypothetical protein
LSGTCASSRILNDRDASAALDRVEPRGAIVERAGEDGADGARPEAAGDGTKQRVDRGARQVLPGSAPQQDVVVVHEHVPARRSDVDGAGHDPVAGFRLHHGQRAGAGEDLGHVAELPHMQHDEDRGGKAMRKRPDEFLQRLDAAGGSADRDDGSCMGLLHRFLLGVAPRLSLARAARQLPRICIGRLLSPSNGNSTADKSALFSILTPVTGRNGASYTAGWSPRNRDGYR